MHRRRATARIGALIRRIGLIIAAIMEDLLILCGLSAVVYATFRLSEIAGWYCLGACLLALGIWLTAHPKRK